jgi:uncharacterized protein involved in cysteine biosynthesis
MILGDFARALGQIGDPRFLRVFGLGLALTVALLVAVYAGFLWLIGLFMPDQLVLPVVGVVTWVGDLVTWGSIFLMLFLSIFLMIPVASAITSMFLDDVADAVEALHYPDLAPAPRVSLYEGIRETINALGLLILLNVVALVFYVFLPISTPLLFVALNGFLLGREYFRLVALRRLGREAARAMGRRYRGQIWIAGMLMTLPLSVPLVNLVIPVLGAATFTHMFHRLARAQPAGGPIR